MTLDQLEAVMAVVESGSFRAASELLHRSQPALSASIKNLEEELGLKIFDRSEYRVRLTEPGTTFVKFAKSTLDSAQYTARVGLELGQNAAQSHLRISIDSLASLAFLKTVVSECQKPTPPVSLVIEKSILKSGYEPLLSGEVDLAIAPYLVGDDRVESLPLEKVRLVSVISKALLGHSDKDLSESLLQSQVQIVAYQKSHDEAVDDLLPNALSKGLGPKIFTPDHATKLRLISEGMGWGRITEDEAARFPDLITIDPTLCPFVDLNLCMLRPKHRSIGPTALAVWNRFEQLSRTKDQT